MWVRKPDEKVKVMVTQNGEIIASKKLEEALPAEMIHIKLDSSKLKDNIPMEVSVQWIKEWPIFYALMVAS